MKKTLLLIVVIFSAFQLAAQDQTVNGKLTVTKQVKWGSTGAVLNTDQGASVELRGTGVPYFDFSNDPTTDFDMRLILRNNNLLSIEGGDLKASDRIRWGNTGAILNTDQGASIELRGTGVPYFDFSNDPTTDFDMRLILRNNNQLSVEGGDLKIDNRVRWGNTGAILNTDQGASIELRGTGVPYFDFSNDATTDYDMRLILRDNNTLGVSGGNLAVDGILKAKEVQVKPNVWADFVFANSYQLPSLEKVENHIKEHGYLPNIPSEKEVMNRGIQLGEMDAKLLQKIEELTLYTIQQEKEIKRLKAIEKRLEKLEKLIQSK
ncbi:hypothetical protein [Aquimarina sp. 2201CG5-10]|uniref:hypothetical protein n=1 Tax=Aquimarina callyspongiae TaxID=3098150 RepID=UPI002AB58843|nr:hypothetical protein [Aquimarina sp. 2201CG5-10]MDY8134843.1 hypothetical protein [Aquimarina sp. 2201CG5-10]